MNRQESAVSRATDTRPSNLSGSKQPTLGYVDIALFFLGVLMLSLASRAAVHLGLLSPKAIAQPPLLLQVAISLGLALNLYLTTLFRHGAGVWSVLGWRWLRPQSFLGAIAGGSLLALLVDLVAHATTHGTYKIHVWELVVIDATLGPFVEETFFRGCLQPVIAQTAGNWGGVLATAVIFASLHQVSTVIGWLCLLTTGTAYGWVRMKSNSTAAAACMHAAYNLTLFLCQFR
jgi:membrane protease YdiL (CAAX protease family)